jgi:hypothetical protein
VYFPGQGWVLFEPTPTRGAPNAQQYTGVPEEQATPSGGATTAPSSTTASTGPATSSTPPTGQTINRDELLTGGQLSSTKQPSFWSTDRLGGQTLVGGGVIIFFVIAYALLVPAIWALYRRRRRQRAVAPDDRVRLAWQESVESVGVLGVAPSRSETPAEFANRAAQSVETDRYADLATTLSAADFSASGVSENDADTAFEISDEVATTVRRQATGEQRIRAVLDPRPPERRRPLRRRRKSQHSRRDAPAIELLKS